LGQGRNPHARKDPVSKVGAYKGDGGLGTYGSMTLRRSSLNRTQKLVLGFFTFAWTVLVVILVAAPRVYDRVPPGRDNGSWALAFLAAISVFLVLLSVGVVRRWRWTFWLILVAFVLGGLLRVPASVLQLVGVLPAQGPAWYTLLQALFGVMQFAIGLVMLAGYRRAGIWGSL
jgi:hypothetical protein